MKSSKVLLLAMVLSGALQLCHAELVPVIGRDPADLTQSLGLRNSGWTFYADVPVLVKAIGFYDHLADGLFDDQQITIWKDTSAQTTFPFINPFTAELALTASVPKGTAATLIGSYRVLMLEADLTLEPGGYEIACQSATGADPGKYLNGNDPISPGVDPRISLGAPAIGEGSPPPEYIAAYGAHLGPMFFIEVPEPSVASLLLVAGMLGLVYRRRA